MERGDARTWLLVHSPVLGPLTWRGVARDLRRRGEPVVVPDLRPTLIAGPPFAGPQAELATRNVSGDVALVLHSGAGALAPAIATRLRSGAGRQPVHLSAVILVDAVLPQPGRSRFDTLPQGLVDHLRSLARDQLLPPWPEWWTEEELAALLSASARRSLIADSPAIPVALFTEPLPEDHLPDDVAVTYLRLSDAYHDEARRAAAHGWRVEHHDSDHLAPISSAARVAQWLRDSTAD